MLGVEMHTTVKTLFAKGHNKSEIGRILGIHRKTVAEILAKLEADGYVERKLRESILDDYKEYIQIQVNKGLMAKRIFQDLRELDNSYTGSYDTVKKYVAAIKCKTSEPRMVMHSLPGEEAQVDFGYIGHLKLKNGKRKKAWIFVMSLSYSRYMYVKIVFNQSVETFINCHKSAFKFIGGVPHIVKIDNLKAAILEADFYQPTIQKNYAAFANHYGFMAEPCRVYTPTDKGKVESNVKYVKNNCFKCREFSDVEEAEEFLSRWIETIANVRVHGTTKKVPKEEFISFEKDKLLSLPCNEFIISDSTKCIVQTNCHISYKGNYYSAPYERIGDKVDVITTDNILKIYFKNKEIALHQIEKTEKGKHITNNNHYPEYKNTTNEETWSTYGQKMTEIGVHAKLFFDRYIENAKNKYEYRAIAGIISLRKKYNDETIDNACHRAYSYNALQYKIVKNICEKGLTNLPVKTNDSYINEKETDISRSLSEYMKYLQ